MVILSVEESPDDFTTGLLMEKDGGGVVVVLRRFYGDDEVQRAVRLALALGCTVFRNGVHVDV